MSRFLIRGAMAWWQLMAASERFGVEAAIVDEKLGGDLTVEVERRDAGDLLRALKHCGARVEAAERPIIHAVSSAPRGYATAASHIRLR